MTPTTGWANSRELMQLTTRARDNREGASADWEIIRKANDIAGRLYE